MIKKTIFVTLFVCVMIVTIITYQLAGSEKQITSQELDIRKYIGADKAKYNSCKGQSSVIAILDSGLSPLESIDENRILFFKDFVNGRNDIYDDNGHGTAITQIIGANRGEIGIAPECKFVVLKILNDKGQANRSDILKAFEWLTNNAEKYNINIVNFSTGVRIHNDEDQELNSLLEEVSEMGIFIVSSTGNSYHRENILFPANHKNVISVGSVDSNYTYDRYDDSITSFTRVGDNSKRPDIYTLGVKFRIHLPLNHSYKNFSGTSFSTAIVSGAIAIVFDKMPNSSKQEIYNYIHKNSLSLYDETLKLKVINLGI